jgi:hypothetical protein
MKIIIKNNNANKLSFCKEVQNLEFTEKIGNIKRYYCTYSQKRDKALAKMGKNYSKRHSEHRIINIRFIKERKSFK